MTKIVWELPLKTVSEANSNEHWAKKAIRHTNQKTVIKMLFKTLETPILPPCAVTMVRLSPRRLDSDENLPMAFKWIKDQIAACLFPEQVKYYKDKKGRIRQLCGREDDNCLVKWEFGQEKSPVQGVRIEIETLGD